MNYLGILLAILRLVDKLSDWFIERKWIAEGERREVARQLIEIARKTKYAHEIMAELDAMPESAIDDILRSLEPGGAPGNDGR